MAAVAGIDHDVEHGHGLSARDQSEALKFSFRSWYGECGFVGPGVMLVGNRDGAEKNPAAGFDAILSKGSVPVFVLTRANFDYGARCCWFARDR